MSQRAKTTDAALAKARKAIGALPNGEAKDAILDALDGGGQIDMFAPVAFGTDAALAAAAKHGKAPVMAALIEAGAAGRTNADGVTCLMLAVLSGDEAAVALLLNGDLDAADGRGMTAAMYAALSGKRSIGAALLSSGASPAIRNRDGLTAADIARRAGHPWP